MQPWVWVLAGGVAAAAMFALGGYLTSVQLDGTLARATITRCEDDHGTSCSGYWVVGGPLGDGGRKIVGTVNDVGWSDLGKTVTVRVTRGGTAFKAGSWEDAEVAFVMGAAALGGGIWLSLRARSS